MKQRMPFADFSELEKDPTLENANSLMNVNAVVSYVENKLKAA